MALGACDYVRYAIGKQKCEHARPHCGIAGKLFKSCICSLKWQSVSVGWKLGTNLHVVVVNEH